MEEYTYGSQEGPQEPQTGNTVVTENVIGGFIGAFIGAIPGVILWCVIGAFGFIGSISAVLMLAGAMKGYTILGKGMSTKGIVASCLVSGIMIFVAVHASWLTALIKEFGFGVVAEEGMFSILAWFWQTAEIRIDLLKELGIGYAFLLFYGFSYVKRKLG